MNQHLKITHNDHSLAYDDLITDDKFNVFAQTYAGMEHTK